MSWMPDPLSRELISLTGFTLLFDVRYGMKHETLSCDEHAFWKFTFHHFGKVIQTSPKLFIELITSENPIDYIRIFIEIAIFYI